MLLLEPQSIARCWQRIKSLQLDVSDMLHKLVLPKETVALHPRLQLRLQLCSDWEVDHVGVQPPDDLQRPRLLAAWRRSTFQSGSTLHGDSTMACPPLQVTCFNQPCFIHSTDPNSPSSVISQVARTGALVSHEALRTRPGHSELQVDEC